MAKPQTHVFVCINERDVAAPKGCCAARGGMEIVKRLKQCVADHDLASKIKVTKSRCLGPCEQGVNMVIYPEGVWYCHVQLDDVKEIFEQHLVAGAPIERLLNPQMR